MVLLYGHRRWSDQYWTIFLLKMQYLRTQTHFYIKIRIVLISRLIKLTLQWLEHNSQKAAGNILATHANNYM